MDAEKKVDLITNLPRKIIGRILSKLPIRDAVRTSTLSKAWAYKWTAISDLDINLTSYEKRDACHLAKSITEYLYRNPGPVNKFFISRLTNHTLILKSLDVWLYLLSRKDVKELRIGLMKPRFFKVPSSCLFNCTKLTRLEMYRCKIKIPPWPISFLFLKSIKFHYVSVLDYNNLISSCPVLESLIILMSRPHALPKLNLTLSAPNLKYLTVRANFRSIYLQNTPLLISAKIATHKLPDQEVIYNFDNFFGRIPCLERLTGEVKFVRYLSKCIDERLAICEQRQYTQLTSIKLNNICFAEEDEIRILLRLIVNSPNLKKLKISEMFTKSDPDSPNYLGYVEKYYPEITIDEDLPTMYNFEWEASADWEFITEQECPNYEEHVFRELKRVEIRKRCRQSPLLMMLVKFILERSPQLEAIMFLWPQHTSYTVKLADLAAFAYFRRASTNVRFHVPQLVHTP